jgi:hypothetical protein
MRCKMMPSKEVSDMQEEKLKDEEDEDIVIEDYLIL